MARPATPIQLLDEERTTLKKWVRSHKTEQRIGLTGDSYHQYLRPASGILFSLRFGCFKNQAEIHPRFGKRD